MTCRFLFSCTLFCSSLARSFTPSSSSCASSSLLSHSPHITSLSSPLPSLSFLFTFILREKKHTPLPFSPSYPVILSSLSVLFLILPPRPPHLPSCLHSLFIFTPYSYSSCSAPSSHHSSRGAALISSAETLSSLGAGINHSPFHTWQSMLYASDVCMLLEVAALLVASK